MLLSCSQKPSDILLLDCYTILYYTILYHTMLLQKGCWLAATSNIFSSEASASHQTGRSMQQHTSNVAGASSEVASVSARTRTSPPCPMSDGSYPLYSSSSVAKGWCQAVPELLLNICWCCNGQHANCLIAARLLCYRLRLECCQGANEVM